MLFFEFKAYGKLNQLAAVDEAIRTAQLSEIAALGCEWIPRI